MDKLTLYIAKGSEWIAIILIFPFIICGFIVALIPFIIYNLFFSPLYFYSYYKQRQQFEKHLKINQYYLMKNGFSKCKIVYCGTALKKDDNIHFGRFLPPYNFVYKYKLEEDNKMRYAIDLDIIDEYQMAKEL